MLKKALLVLAVFFSGLVLAFDSPMPLANFDQPQWLSVASGERFYDDHGRYQGKRDANGRYYDDHGRYQGRQDSNGRFYDDHGRYRGKRDDNGRYYDDHGRYRGRAQ